MVLLELIAVFSVVLSILAVVLANEDASQVKTKSSARTRSSTDGASSSLQKSEEDVPLVEDEGDDELKKSWLEKARSWPVVGTFLGVVGFGAEEKVEVVELTESFKRFVRSERKYKLASSFAFIAYVFLFAVPLWCYSTSVYRAPFPTFPPNRTINVPVRILLATTEKSMIPIVEELMLALEVNLTEKEVALPLEITWTTRFVGVKTFEELEEEKVVDDGNDATYDVYVAVVSAKDWKHFSATQVQLSVKKWSFVQWNDENAARCATRVTELVWEILIDVPHLNTIVRRDLRERMPPWQVATLPLSHQKRLVWDSAPLAMNYRVQVVHLHDNSSPATEDLQLQAKTPRALRVFAQLVKSVTNVEVTSEHLWDFNLNSFLRKDVQDRWTLTHTGTEDLLKQVDSELQTTLNSGAVLRIVVLETPQPVVILDEMGEDTRGLAVAAWGAVLPRDEKTEARAVAALRVHLGMDAELLPGWWRPPVPICAWEVDRARLRASVDNGMRAASAVRALHEMTKKITNIVINDGVAGRATEAVRLLEAALQPGKRPDYDKLVKARELADSANTDQSLLALLYFPMDQRTAVLIPIALPVVFPVLKATFCILKRFVMRDWL